MALRSNALKELMKRCIQGAGIYDKTLLNNVKLLAADKGRVTCELQVEPQHTNRSNMLHGGMTSTLVDSITTMALVSTDKPYGVSVDLNLSFLSGARLGDTLLVEAQVDKAGKNMAFMSALVRNKHSGRVIAKGYHTKYIAIPDAAPQDSIPSSS